MTACFREGESIFDVIRHQDALLHHPYVRTLHAVVEFFRSAAKDPDVLAIRATLYRVGTDSPIVKALIEAAERGKQVAVLVELYEWRHGGTLPGKRGPHAPQSEPPRRNSFSDR